MAEKKDKAASTPPNAPSPPQVTLANAQAWAAAGINAAALPSLSKGGAIKLASKGLAKGWPTGGTAGSPTPPAPTPPIVTSPVRVAIVDHPSSGAPDSATLAKFAAAMQKSLAGDFAPFYMMAPVVVFATTPLPTDWIIGLFRDADQPGALGYHDLAPNGQPFAKVFPLLDAQDGSNLSSTIDHELKEMLVDPTIDRARQATDGQFWADEACDAVESDEYTVDGVPLSNFVLPSWYSGLLKKYDFLGKLTAPLTLTPGGYAQYFDPQQGWQQVFDRKKPPRSYRRQQFGRSTLRRAHAPAKKPHHPKLPGVPA